MSEAKKCDGCGEIIDEEREQWIEIQVNREKEGLIGSNDDTFPVDEKTLHFHCKEVNMKCPTTGVESTSGKNCIEKISSDSLHRKVKK